MNLCEDSNVCMMNKSRYIASLHEIQEKALEILLAQGFFTSKQINGYIVEKLMLEFHITNNAYIKKLKNNLNARDEFKKLLRQLLFPNKINL